MNDTHVIIDAGTLQFNEDDLTATGLLIPYGVPARSNLGTFTFAAGDVMVPTDLTGMSLNIEHKREDVVGGFTKAWEQAAIGASPAGVMATFKYRDTPAGRQAFEDGKTGKRRNLSAEVAHVRIKDGKALPGALLFAAAQVEKPAFEGATLLAAEDTPSSDAYSSPDSSSSSQYVTEFTDSEGVKWRRVETNTSTTTVEKVDGEQGPEATPAEDNPEGGSTVTANATEPGQQAPAIVPTTLLASAPTAPAPGPSAEPEVDFATMFAAMATIGKGIPDKDAETLLGALSDIKWNTAGGLTTAASGVLQPAWVGKLWQGKRYQRKFIDLFTRTFGGIQLGGRKGFTLDQGTALVAKWAGNKANMPSGTAATAVKGSSLQPYGYGADLPLEWYHLEGGAALIQAFFEGVADSYAEVTDADALAAIFLAASKTAADLDRLVAPDAGYVPTVGTDTFPAAVGALIQGIELIQDANDEPTGALVNPTAWKQLISTPQGALPEYVKLDVQTGGTGTADGKVIVRKAPASAFVGLDAADPAVIVGAKPAIEFREQGEVPIQIDALNIAQGGTDKAVIGYVETFIVRPESLVLIGTAAA